MLILKINLNLDFSEKFPTSPKDRMIQSIKYILRGPDYPTHPFMNYRENNILSQDENITFYGNPTMRGAVIPFNVKNIHPHDLAKFLDTDGICIRAGHHCAQPIMNKLKISATARASFYIYNTRNDIEKLVEGIKKTADIFN